MLSFNVTRSAFIQNKQNEKQSDFRSHYAANNKYREDGKRVNEEEVAAPVREFNSSSE